MAGALDTDPPGGIAARMSWLAAAIGGDPVLLRRGRAFPPPRRHQVMLDEIHARG